MSSNYTLVYNSKLCAALECAIEHLTRIERNISCDGTGQLSPMVNEQVDLFFDNLTKFNNCLLMKDNQDDPVIVPGPVTNTSDVEHFGIYKYSSYKCRKFESNLISITIPGIVYAGGSPTTPEGDYYLSTLLGTDVYYEPPVPDDGVLIDKDDINRAICQLRNHYRAIIKYTF